MDPGGRDGAQKSGSFFQNAGRIPNGFRKSIAPYHRMIQSALKGKARPRKGPLVLGNWEVAERPDKKEPRHQAAARSDVNTAPDYSTGGMSGSTWAETSDTSSVTSAAGSSSDGTSGPCLSTSLVTPGRRLDGRTRLATAGRSASLKSARPAADRGPRAPRAPPGTMRDAA